jgi:hypothetical protein
MEFGTFRDSWREDYRSSMGIDLHVSSVQEREVSAFIYTLI